MSSQENSLRVLDPRGQPTGIFGRRLYRDENGDDILDLNRQPTASQEAFAAFRMAPRLTSLDNRTIYLVDVGFEGGYALLEEVVDWFAAKMPSVKTVLRKKSGGMFSDDPELWAEIKAKAQAAIIGVGG